MPTIGLDFETYGAVDLRKHGLYRYTNDPSFQVLIGCADYLDDEGGLVEERFDFVFDYTNSVDRLERLLLKSILSANNALFELRCLDWLKIQMPDDRVIDSAVVSRAVGGGSHLAETAPQLLDMPKMAEGRDLIKLFSIPGKYQEVDESNRFDPQVVEDHPTEWEQFFVYCQLDAHLSRRITQSYYHMLTPQEFEYARITMRMNQQGWIVDRALVEEMQRRYHENLRNLEQVFRTVTNSPDLNLNSLKQMKEWCGARGIKARSFDERRVAAMLPRIEEKLLQPGLTPEQASNYRDVVELLKVKQALGGSSLKKLDVMLDHMVPDQNWVSPVTRWRLMDQYVHCGAGQTLRTSGRTVQMQNLKRLGTEVDDTSELFLSDANWAYWTNTRLASNLRQVFTSRHPNGQLVVGDFASVESIGLAWLADERWKLAAHRENRGVYEELASRIFGVPTENVSPSQRQAGKVGELACGYQAGAEAVASFAERMGIPMDTADAAVLVYDWRDACPFTVDLWDRLDVALREIVQHQETVSLLLADGKVRLNLRVAPTPVSLQKQHPGCVSIQADLMHAQGGQHTMLRRYFHGCYPSGRDICYYRPSGRKTGALWSSTFTNPKTKRLQPYKLYGGKLTGILTQSLCREIFFATLSKVDAWVLGSVQLQLVGQFHDEIVVDWVPDTLSEIGGGYSLLETKQKLSECMSSTAPAGFPLSASVKSDYRYIK